MEIKEYNYTIDSVDEDKGSVTVTYTALDTRLKPQTVEVRVPFNKAEDEDHLERIVEQKVRARAPTSDWAAALATLERPVRQPVRASEALSSRGMVGVEKQVRKPEPKTREQRLQETMLTEEATRI